MSECVAEASLDLLMVCMWYLATGKLGPARSVVLTVDAKQWMDGLTLFRSELNKVFKILKVGEL